MRRAFTLIELLVVIAMIDGSVRYVSDSIPLGLYRALATVAGEEVVTVP